MTFSARNPKHLMNADIIADKWDDEKIAYQEKVAHTKPAVC